MKRILNGKVYNSEKLTKVTELESNVSYNDFGYFKKTLCIAPDGEFIMVGETYNDKYMEHMTIWEVINWLEDNQVDLEDIDSEVRAKLGLAE